MENVINIRPMLVLLVLTGFLAFGPAGCEKEDSLLSPVFEKEEVEREAKRSIDFFNRKDYEGIRDMGSQDLKDSITAEELAQYYDPYVEKRGEFKEIVKTVVMGRSDKKSQGEYAYVIMVGEYEHGKIQFNIGLDQEMKLIQFLIK